MSGYSLTIPVNLIDNGSKIRVVAVSDGRATELPYKKKNKYFRNLKIKYKTRKFL